MYTCMLVCGPVYMCWNQRRTSGVLLNHSLLGFLPESGAYVLEGGGLANELQRSVCIFLHNARNTGTRGYSLMWMMGLQTQVPNYFFLL